MKIEMGESLIRTWLRHCLGCQLAELNWKPSPKWPTNDSSEVEQWYEDGKAQFPVNVFKKTATLEQFLGQAEIDVLGICIEQSKIKKIFAADVACHTKGLQYGSKSETKARIIKKMFRSALIMERYFPDIPAEILFLSPKVTPATELGVSETSQMVQTFFAARRKNFHFKTIINSKFKDEIFDKTLSLTKIVSDTSELFLRAEQLADIFDENPLILTKNVNINNAPVHNTSLHFPTTYSKTLPIELVPNDKKEFKKLLLERRSATIFEYYQDGSTEKKKWSIEKLNERSNILANLRTRKCYKQGEWQKRGLIKLVVKISGYES